MDEEKANHFNSTAQQESFTCVPLVLVFLLTILEFFRNLYIDPLVHSLQAVKLPSWEQHLVPVVVPFVVLMLIFTLLYRPKEVILEAESIQIGNSPLHYYRADEIREIKFKGGVLRIRTTYLWHTRLYEVKKKQREKAHHLLSDWAYKNGILYRIM